jgi:hypothetical protein
VNAFAADKEDGVAIVGGKQKLRFRGANLIEFGQLHFSSERVPLMFIGSSGAKAQCLLAPFGTTEVVP